MSTKLPDRDRDSLTAYYGSIEDIPHKEILKVFMRLAEDKWALYVKNRKIKHHTKFTGSIYWDEGYENFAMYMLESCLKKG